MDMLEDAALQQRSGGGGGGEGAVRELGERGGWLADWLTDWRGRAR